MPTQLEDLAQQVRLLRSGTLTGITGGGGGGGGTTVTASSNVVASFSASGVVVPTPNAKLWPLTTSGTIGAVEMTMGTAPLTGRSCVIDIQLNGNSIFASLPAYTDTTTNPFITLVSANYEPGNILTAYIIDGGSGRDLEVLVTEQ